MPTTTQPAPTATAVPAPAVAVTAQGGDLRVESSFGTLPVAPQRRPVRVLVTATRVGRPDLVSAGGSSRPTSATRTSCARRAATVRSRCR
ncbi:MAG TPA: hypothetical protein VHF51_20510 [Solirubrobacteraceae bacterium]|nr:hypothetical protein [Solirubrobacteraceae bacterium]